MMSSSRFMRSIGLALVIYVLLTLRRVSLIDDIKEVVNAGCVPMNSTCGVPGDGVTAYLYANLIANLKIGDLVFAFAAFLLGLLFTGNREGRA